MAESNQKSLINRKSSIKKFLIKKDQKFKNRWLDKKSMKTPMNAKKNGRISLLLSILLTQ